MVNTWFCSAPDGCTQYFTGTSGTFSSYNFGGGIFLDGMSYSNCIRQEYGDNLNTEMSKFSTALDSRNLWEIEMYCRVNVMHCYKSISCQDTAPLTTTKTGRHLRTLSISTERRPTPLGRRDRYNFILMGTSICDIKKIHPVWFNWDTVKFLISLSYFPTYTDRHTDKWTYYMSPEFWYRLN